VGWLWLWSASLREHQAPASEDELAEFETDVLAGFVLARASAGLTDSPIRNDTNHLALLARLMSSALASLPRWTRRSR
jgi:hypothetical protein